MRWLHVKSDREVKDLKVPREFQMCLINVSTYPQDTTAPLGEIFIEAPTSGAGGRIVQLFIPQVFVEFLLCAM